MHGQLGALVTRVCVTGQLIGPPHAESYACCMQLHAQGGGSVCSADGRLVLAQRDLRDIFIASTAELPGLLIAALVMDAFGRKWYAFALSPM